MYARHTGTSSAVLSGLSLSQPGLDQIDLVFLLVKECSPPKATPLWNFYFRVRASRTLDYYVHKSGANYPALNFNQMYVLPAD
jgi:hypothetical protein